MNIFEKYGIKEVADVTFYSITNIGDEEILTPVLFFDSLKVSSISKGMDNSQAKGGKANQTIISWGYQKDIKLKLEDALFSQASMNVYMNGLMKNKISPYLSIVSKTSIANKYGKLHYSKKAYPSPELTDDEWNIVYYCAENIGFSINGHSSYVYKEDIDNRYIAESRFTLRHNYINRLWNSNDEKAMPKEIIEEVFNQINNLKRIGQFQNDLYETKCIERFEKCLVGRRDGLVINPVKQREALMKYYCNEKDNYTIFYDPKTMLPFFDLRSGEEFQLEPFVLKYGTIYYKYTRTIMQMPDENTILGIDLKINPEFFPCEYKIVGETFVRQQKTGRDQRYQFTIKRAKISSSTNVDLKADGNPLVFSMDIDVLASKDKIPFSLTQFDVENDIVDGGTKIKPQNRKNSYTKVVAQECTQLEDNLEIY